MSADEEAPAAPVSPEGGRQETGEEDYAEPTAVAEGERTEGDAPEGDQAQAVEPAAGQQAEQEQVGIAEPASEAPENPAAHEGGDGAATANEQQSMNDGGADDQEHEHLTPAGATPTDEGQPAAAEQNVDQQSSEEVQARPVEASPAHGSSDAGEAAADSSPSAVHEAIIRKTPTPPPAIEAEASQMRLSMEDQNLAIDKPGPAPSASACSTPGKKSKGGLGGMRKLVPPEGCSQSAPTSPVTPMRSRQAQATLKAVLESGDALLLARKVLQDRQSQEAYKAATAERLQEVNQTQRTTAPQATVTKTTPASLVVHPGQGQYLTKPEGWRSNWSASDYRQVLAADMQLQSEAARQAALEKKAFVAELAKRAEEFNSRSGSPTGRSPRPRSRAGTGASSPTLERQQRIMATAQQLWQQKQEAMERKTATKEQQASARVAQLEKMRANEAAAKQQETDRAIQEAQQRAELMDGYRSAVMRYDASRKEDQRNNVILRKEVGISQQSQARSAHSLHAGNLVQTRHQQIADSYSLYAKEKVKNRENLTAAATRRHTAMTSDYSHRIASSRQQRFSTAAEKLAEQKRLNALAEKTMMAELARREAIVERRNLQEAKRDKEIQHKQLGELVTRHYAKEFELRAMIENKLPAVPPDVINTLARYNVKA